jgi:bifunctional N-acetylglucosamine-1-phosphate-uridyltransferase/glucosamine-1-phosphate-acetyltransferase GlmU-like protein
MQIKAIKIQNSDEVIGVNTTDQLGELESWVICLILS